MGDLPESRKWKKWGHFLPIFGFSRFSIVFLCFPIVSLCFLIVFLRFPIVEASERKDNYLKIEKSIGNRT